MATAVKTPKKPVKSGREEAQELLARYAEVSALLDAQKAARKPLEEEYMTLRQRLQNWCDAAENDDEFIDGETIKLEMGSFGYRQGPEKLALVLDTELNEVQRTAAIVEACKKLLPDAVKVGYDEKYLVRAWPSQPKLQKALAGIVEGVRREQQFIISLRK